MEDDVTSQARAPEEKQVQNQPESGGKPVQGDPPKDPPKKAGYNGSKHPMLALQLLKSSKAVQNALGRIEKRRVWIRARIPQLKIQFSSDNPTEKEEAYNEAEALKVSISKLDEAEPKLREMLPKMVEKEKAKLESLEFPEINI